MKDERVMQSMNKIWGEIGRLTYYLAAASFVVKCLFFGFKLEDCIPVSYTHLDVYKRQV